MSNTKLRILNYILGGACILTTTLTTMVGSILVDSIKRIDFGLIPFSLLILLPYIILLIVNFFGSSRKTLITTTIISALATAISFVGYIVIDKLFAAEPGSYMFMYLPLILTAIIPVGYIIRFTVLNYIFWLTFFSLLIIFCISLPLVF
jgi:hypothetical protein